MNAEQKAILKDAVEWVEWQDGLPEDARAWYQGDWVKLKHDDADNVCGTAYCLAGYIGQKHEPQFAHDEFAMVDGRLTHVSNYVENLLGIEVGGYTVIQLSHQFGEDEGEYAYDLFDADNTAEDIRRIAEYLAGEPL